MKAWIKYLFAAGIGFLYVQFIPYFKNDIEWLLQSSRMIMNIVPFFLYPIMFITLSAGLGALLKLEKLWGNISFSILWGISVSAVVAISAAVILMLMPVTVLPEIPELSQSLRLLLPAGRFPASAAVTEFAPGRMLLFFGVIVGAFFLGGNLNPNTLQLKPAYAVINSLAEVLYKTAWCFTELLSIAVLFLAGAWFSVISPISIFSAQYVLFLTASLIGLFSIFILLPVLVWIYSKENQPFRWILLSLAPLLSGFFSGSYQTALLPLYTSSRHNMGAAKRITSTTIPIISIFGRGGTAAMAMILLYPLILQSPAGQAGSVPLMLLAAVCLAASFLSILVPGAEILFTFTIAGYFIGLDAIPYMAILIPVIPLLRSIGTAVDIMISVMGTGCSAKRDASMAAIGWKKTI